MILLFVEFFAPGERYMPAMDRNMWWLWCAGKAPDKKLNWGQAVYALAIQQAVIMNLDVS